MILNGIINFVIDLFLIPVSAIDIGVNWLLGFEYVKSFLQVVAYVLPWNNIIPLITLIIAVFVFRAVIALIKTLWDLLPVL